jgi:hypothetical protein
MSQEDLQSRSRTLRVWPDPDDDNFPERMEEIQTIEPSQVSPAAAAAVPPAPAKPSAAKKKDTHIKSKSETKKRSSSMDQKADESNEQKKKKAKKDPTKPKRAATLYSLYMQDNRTRISEENPGISFGEVVSWFDNRSSFDTASSHSLYASLL